MASSTTPLYERVTSDPQLSKAEKETNIGTYGGGDEARVSSFHRGVTRSLLRHDHFEIEEIRGVDHDGEYQRWDDRDAAAEEANEVYGVVGHVPVGCLTIKSKPRTNNHHSSVVSWDTVDPDAFE